MTHNVTICYYRAGQNDSMSYFDLGNEFYVTAGFIHDGQNVPIFILTSEMNSWCPITCKLIYNMQMQNAK